MPDDDPTIDQLFGVFRQTRFNESVDPNRLIQSDAPGTGNPQPVGWIQDGVVTGDTFDATAPDLPTGLTLNSAVFTNSDGSSFVNLFVGLVQPSDTDLFGSYVQVTGHDDGAGNPVWDDPLEVLIGADQTEATVHNVLGNHQYWARARAADVLGNFSAFTATVTHTTVRDTTSPPAPDDPVLTPGFRGFAAYWTGGDAIDRAYYELRYAPGAAPPVDDSWTYVQALVSVVWVPDLTPGTLYWAEVRSVDRSGNVSAWSNSVSVTPSLVGSADIAANSISAAAGHIADLNADDIEAGTLRIRDANGFAEGILVYGPVSDTVPVIEINAPTDEGIIRFRDPVAEDHQLLIEAGTIKFTEDGGVTDPTTAMSSEGINAEAIRFGAARGGHNLVSNASFELSGFVSAPTTAVFTDTAGTPGWKAANRTTSPDNITEGTTLAATTLAF